MEQEPAVAFEQHDPAVAALPTSSRNAERTRQAVADVTVGLDAGVVKGLFV
jgi:hypothetical protein